MKLKLLLFALIMHLGVYSQEGIITGKVTNEIGEPIQGVIVRLKEGTKGDKTNSKGEYKFSAIAGSFEIKASCMNYESKIEFVNVQTLEKTVVDFVLKSNAKKIKSISVTSVKNKESEKELMFEQKKQIVIEEKIGAQEMSKKGVSDAAQAVSKISGVSKGVGADAVFVRGMGDRYISTSMNHLSLPSENPENKNISLDYFPSEIIKNVAVSKTYNGLLFGDFGAASIDIVTKEFTGKPSLKVNIGTGFNSQSISNWNYTSGMSYLGGISNSEISTTKNNTFFDPNWISNTTNAPRLNNKIGLNLGYYKSIGTEKSIAFYIAPSIQNNFEYNDGYSGVFGAQSILKNVNSQNYSYSFTKNLLTNFIYRLNKNNRLKLNFVHIDIASDNVSKYKGYDYSVNSNISFYRSTVDKVDMNILQLLGEHSFSDRATFNWGIGGNILNQNQPNRKTYKLLEENNRSILSPSSGENNIYYQSLDDKDLSSFLHFKYRFNKDIEETKTQVELQLDYSSRVKARDFTASQFDFTPFSYLSNGNTFNSESDIQNYFNESNLNSNYYSIVGRRVENGQVKPQTYLGRMYTQSGNAALQINMPNKWELLLGLRADYIYQYVIWDVIGVAKPKGASDFEYVKPLPYLNMRYPITENIKFKAGLSKTYTLAQFKETAPFVYENVATNNSFGNPYLYPSDNYNLDLKLENFFSKTEMYSFTLFSKQIYNPINKTIIASSGASEMSYVNTGNSAFVAGLEMELKKEIFSDIKVAKTINTTWFFGLNAALMYTQQDLSNTKAASETKGFIQNIFNSNSSPLQGSSPFVMNADISCKLKYKTFEPTFTLVYNYFSDRLYSLGVLGINDNYERRVQTIDFISKLPINKSFDFSINLKNINNPSYDRYQTINGEEVLTSSFKRGINASFGLSYKVF